MSKFLAQGGAPRSSRSWSSRSAIHAARPIEWDGRGPPAESPTPTPSPTALADATPYRHARAVRDRAGNRRIDALHLRGIRAHAQRA